MALSALFATYRASGRLEAGLAVPRVQFFCFHHVFADEEEPFRRLVGALSRHFDFASWSEGVKMVDAGKRPARPVACFSSDDGVANNLALARILEEFGATACFFINPVTLERRSDAFNAYFCREKLQARPMRFLSGGDMESLLSRGHEIGNHTQTHVICSETPKDALVEEIAGAKSILERRFGPIPHFAWPYGQVHHFSQLGLRIAREAGHSSIAGVIRGAHLVEGEGEAPYLRRDQLWALDPVGHALYFSARAGLHPASAQELPYSGQASPRSQSPVRHRRFVGWPFASGHDTQPAGPSQQVEL